MHKYRVVERWVEDSRMAIRCSRGHYHLTRALGLLPAADTRLEGARPHLGFGILLCPMTGAMFRVIFESIGNTGIPLAPNATPNGTPSETHKLQGQSFGVPGRADQGP